MPKPPPLPPPLTRPLCAPIELKAALEYVEWLADEVEATSVPGSPPHTVAAILQMTMAAAASSVHGRHAPLATLYDAVIGWASGLQSHVAGMTIGQAVAAGLDAPTDPRTN